MKIISPVFRRYILQYIVAFAVHLMIIPMFANGFNIIKYVTNHPKLFDSAIVAYLLGLT